MQGHAACRNPVSQQLAVGILHVVPPCNPPGWLGYRSHRTGAPASATGGELRQGSVGGPSEDLAAAVAAAAAAAAVDLGSAPAAIGVRTSPLDIHTYIHEGSARDGVVAVWASQAKLELQWGPLLGAASSSPTRL
eukprot:scaffold1183_cov418-Prasinococcus_capsulatus_cf.AAC.7